MAMSLTVVRLFRWRDRPVLAASRDGTNRLARTLPAMIDSLPPLPKHGVRTVAVDRPGRVGTGAGLRLLLSVL
jgi:hypothetical protein